MRLTVHFEEYDRWHSWGTNLESKNLHTAHSHTCNNLSFIFSSWELLPYSHYVEGFTLPNKYLSTVNKNCRPHGILNVASYHYNSITNSTDIIISFFIIFCKSSSVCIDFTFIHTFTTLLQPPSFAIISFSFGSFKRKHFRGDGKVSEFGMNGQVVEQIKFHPHIIKV